MDRLTEWRDDKKLLAKAKFSGDFGSQNILQSLAEYEDLEELIGISLKNLAEICNNKIPEECRNPKKAIVLTDNDVDRWNEYKNAEKQGLLLRLPCKIGDTVYIILASYFDIGTYNIKYAEADVRDFTHFTSCGFCVVVTSKVFGKLTIPFSDFGKTVFLTKEKAEKKLKEMESD